LQEAGLPPCVPPADFPYASGPPSHHPSIPTRPLVPQCTPSWRHHQPTLPQAGLGSMWVTAWGGSRSGLET
jgi:hypothetical protein